MVAALQKAGRPVPKYLLTIAQHSEHYEPIYLAAPVLLGRRSVCWRTG